MSKKNEWISVKEKLPEMSKENNNWSNPCLVTNGHIIWIAALCRTFLASWISLQAPEYIIDDNIPKLTRRILKEDPTLEQITHWMPLPEPPNYEVKNEDK